MLYFLPRYYSDGVRSGNIRLSAVITVKSVKEKRITYDIYADNYLWPILSDLFRNDCGRRYISDYQYGWRGYRMFGWISNDYLSSV